MSTKKPTVSTETKHLIIERDSVGFVTCEAWHKDGKEHREGGPAYIVREPVSGIVTYESWSQDGRLHRLGGPAVIKRDPVSGIVTREEWYRNGEPVSAPSPPSSLVPR